MLISLDATYFVTLALATPAESEVFVAARNTYSEPFIGQVVRAARIQIHLRRAKKMWLEELTLIEALDRQGNKHISNFAQPLYLQVSLPEAQLMLALLRLFDCEVLYNYNPPRSAEAWGSLEALRALVATMDARWDAIITRALAVPAVTPA